LLFSRFKNSVLIYLIGVISVKSTPTKVIKSKISIVVRTELGSRWSRIGVTNIIERNWNMLIMALRNPTDVASPIYG